MEANEVKKMLEKVGVPVTNTKFPPGKIVKPPFICFLNTDIIPLIADNKVFTKFYRYDIELYTSEFRDEELEKKLIDTLEESENLWKFDYAEEVSKGIMRVVYQI